MLNSTLRGWSYLYLKGLWSAFPQKNIITSQNNGQFSLDSSLLLLKRWLVWSFIKSWRKFYSSFRYGYNIEMWNEFTCGWTLQDKDGSATTILALLDFSGPFILYHQPWYSCRLPQEVRNEGHYRIYSSWYWGGGMSRLKPLFCRLSHASNFFSLLLWSTWYRWIRSIVNIEHVLSVCWFHFGSTKWYC